MINSTLRRTALAAVAALSLGTAAESAAARADAALSIALGALHAPLASMAQLQAQPQKPAAASAQAQVQGPAAPADVWEKVLGTAMAKGKASKIGPQWRASYTLNDTIGDPNGQQVVHLIVVHIAIDPNPPGGWETKTVGVQFLDAEKKYITEAGQWRIDAWVFETDASGLLLKARHNTQMLPDGAAALGKGTDAMLDLADPKTKARYDAMLKYWAER